MENELLGIGRFGALSGLSVGTLRFYDGVGVLRPALVDPVSGYRFYRTSQVRPARIVAHLRRVGLPLDDIRAVLDRPTGAATILAVHLGRLEAGLADARREISIVHHLIDETETTMTRYTLPAADLVRALHDVRYAVSSDPDLPALNGVFLESEPGRLRVVATDRFRLATSTVVTAEPTDLHLLLPTATVDELLAAPPTGYLEVTVADGAVTLSGEHGTTSASLPDADYPAYRSFLELGRREVPVDAAALRAALDAGATESRSRDGIAYDVSRLSFTADGVRVGPSDDADATVVAVNRDFFREALAAGDQLVLGLDDPIAPLAIRHPGRDGKLSILMPVRLDQPA